MEIKAGLLPYKSNYKQSRNTDIKYIVIHYTGNKGDTALNNVKYFANNTVKASAHFFVDENSIYTSVPVNDTAWHCGGGLQGSKGHAWYGKCTNSNSIGIEMCLLDKSGNVRKDTIDKTAELTKYLMNVYKIPAENVIRHWDVTGKSCPAPMRGDNNEYWESFKNRISESEELTMAQYEEIMKKLEEHDKIINLVGDDIQNVNKRVDEVEKENNRQNEIINLVGNDIQKINKKVGI